MFISKENYLHCCIWKSRKWKRKEWCQRTYLFYTICITLFKFVTTSLQYFIIKNKNHWNSKTILVKEDSTIRWHKRNQRQWTSINRSLLDKTTVGKKMMNGEKKECFNILGSTIKQAAHKLLDVGKIAASVVECWATSIGLRMI